MIRLAFICFSLQAISCGVEVGNPTKPVAPSAEEQEALALATTQQYEETVDASSENYDSSESTLRLLPLGTCVPNGDGSVNLSFDRTIDLTAQYPRRAPVRSIQRQSTKTIAAKLSSPNELLTCLPSGRAPLLNWITLSELKIETTANRSESRIDTDLSTNQTISSLSYTAESTRTISWKRKSYEDRVLTAEKTLTFDSTLSSGEKSVGIKTQDALVIEQSNTRGAVTSFVIHGGSVLSNYKEGQKLLLRYQDLTFSSSGSCHPASGTITASIHAEADLQTALVSFQMVFADGEAHLTFADGSTRELPLADCSFE